MATTAVSVNSGHLNPVAARLVGARNEVARIERLLNIAKTDALRFPKDDERQAKLKKHEDEHPKFCARRDALQREYESLPTCAETLKGLAEFRARAEKTRKEGRDLTKALETRDALNEIGNEYTAYLSERDGEHARQGLLNCQESFGARARSWTGTSEFEESCRKILAPML